MRRTIGVVALSASVLVLGGCTSTDEGPSEGALRQTACESFAEITPGFYESTAAIGTLSDPSASTSDRAEAMSKQLEAMSGSNKRTRPYDCNDPRDEEYFADFYSGFMKDQQAEK
ncbi:hypothetical protein A6F55_23895 [Prescottella equi]|uniref:hypothetical protein n=1 Tax=Rhodococcus hoagii TaxID=43767 RepID=UPI000A224B1D|nr:hypothetical protein [Prescottella equi]ORJ92608.1 hypothetical protein A6F55_23895 [Prescottella equi]